MSAVILPGPDWSPEEQFGPNEFSSDIAEALWFADDLSGLMDNLANRLTDVLRTTFTDPTLNKTGDVLIERLYVHVLALKTFAELGMQGREGTTTTEAKRLQHGAIADFLSWQDPFEVM